MKTSVAKEEGTEPAQKKDCAVFVMWKAPSPSFSFNKVGYISSRRGEKGEGRSVDWGAEEREEQ